MTADQKVDPAFQASFVAFLVPFIQATSDEPFPTLDVIGYVRAWLDEIEDDLVLKARVEDATWLRIADAIDRSREAARERHREALGSGPEDTSWSGARRLAS